MAALKQNRFFLLTLCVLSFLILAPQLAHAKTQNSNGTSKNILSDVATKFKSHENNVGRVSMTEFSPLSVSISENNISYIGLSFLTQKDAAPSTGVGAAFNF